MKKSIFTLMILLFIGSICNAQEHLTFKGIPIDGKLNEFVSKLQNEGYVLNFTNDEGNACILEGAFAGFANCKIFVLSTPYSHIVWKVAVKLPEQNSWYSLKSRYNDFKNSLTQKYGDPENDYHFFSSPYYEGDGFEFQALRKDKCSYAAFFDTQTGYISIEIESKEYDSGRVSIAYEDKANTKLKKEDQQQSINNDL